MYLHLFTTFQPYYMRNPNMPRTVQNLKVFNRGNIKYKFKKIPGLNQITGKILTNLPIKTRYCECLFKLLIFSIDLSIKLKSEKKS